MSSRGASWTDRDLAVGRTAVTSATSRRSVLRLAMDAAVVALAFVAYATARRWVTGEPSVAMAHARSLLHLESTIGLDVERSWNRALAAHATPASVTRWLYLAGNWTVVAAALAWLWARDRTRFSVLRDGLAIAAVAGLVCAWRYPVAPPRLLAGYTDLVYSGWQTDGRASGGSNAFAAFPSFHVGWPAAAAVVVAPTIRRPIARAATYVPALVLAPVVIATANHYVIDVAGGIVIAVGAVRLTERARSHRLLPAVERFGRRAPDRRRSIPAVGRSPASGRPTTSMPQHRRGSPPPGS